MYRVFTRNWWRYAAPDEDGTPGYKLGLPTRRPVTADPGARRRIIVTRVATEQEAQEICRRWNALHSPGPLSRKAEYEET